MKKLLLIFCLFTTYLVLATHAYAQRTNTITVSPSIVELDLAKDQPQATITYTNHSPNTIEVSFQAQNFTEREDTYQLSFLSAKDANNYKYGLSSWIQFSTKTLVVEPGQSDHVILFIEAQKLTPGTHYASILATVNTFQASSQPVGIIGVLSSLLFVRTHTGAENETARLASMSLERNWFDFPDTISFRFNNTGDTELTPYGLAQVYSGNRLIAKGIVNIDSAPTLPESIRKYFVPIQPPEKFILPGFYKLHLVLHFGESNKYLTQNLLFFSQGSIPFPLVILLLGGGSFCLVWYKKRKAKKSEVTQ